MKVIDLYLDLANGKEVPKKIRICGLIFELIKDWNGYRWYANIDTAEAIECSINRNLEFILNLDVEIIEEKPKMTDKEKIKEVIRYMKACIRDAKKYCSKEVYRALKDCYEYPLEILKKSDKDG